MAGVAQRDNAVLLIGASDPRAVNPVARFAADLAVTEIVALTLGATITTHGHPAGIGDNPAFGQLMADHRGQHAQRQLFGLADTNVVHDQI
nr:hypothetical protein [Tanacetum cinerariifolium]